MGCQLSESVIRLLTEADEFSRLKAFDESCSIRKPLQQLLREQVFPHLGSWIAQAASEFAHK